MKSSSYTEGLTMSPEHIDTATNSVRSSLRPGQGAAKRPKNKLKAATIFVLRLCAGPAQTRPHPFMR